MAKSAAHPCKRLEAALLTLVVAGGSPGQEPSPARLPLQARAVVLDGDLREWEGALVLRVVGREQVVASPDAWGGLNDASATLSLSYDAAHLYLAGEVLDNDLVREREPSGGDGIEIFLDTSADPSAPPLAQDRVKIALLPPSRLRRVRMGPWGSADAPEDAALGGAALTGVRLVHRELAGRGYQFEAILPFHNLPGLRLGTRRLGFDIALHDHDAGGRQQILTWSGAAPGSGPLPVLQFEDQSPLEPGPQDGRGLYDRIADLVPYVVWPLLMLAAGVLALRLWSWLCRGRPVARTVGHGAGAALLVVGLLLPRWLVGLHEYRNAQKLDAIVQALQLHLPEMEKGTLGSYRGGERDLPFVDLLSGKSVPRKHTVTHESLVDLAEGGFGDGPYRYPVEGFAVRPYWIPLPAGQTEELAFGQPLIGRRLNLVLSLPTLRNEDSAPTVRLSLLAAGEASPRVEVIALQRQLYTSCISLGHPEREMTFVQLPLALPLQSISASASDAHGLRLVGLTLVPTERDTEGVPLDLGQATLGGVETDLRGGYPEEAGVRLLPGQQRRVRIRAERLRSFEKLWLFYKADYPGAGKPLPFRGERVCEVVLRFSGGKPEPRAIELHHQESMFFDLASQNRDQEPRHARASVALRWEDEAREQRLNLGYEESLPEGAVVEEVEFKNLTSCYAIRFRSAVFRESKPTVRVEPVDSPLELTESHREVRLKQALLERIRGASFAIYRGGKETTRSGALTLPGGIRRKLSPERVERRVVDAGDAQLLEAYFPLPGDGWAGAVLGVSLADEAHGEAVRAQSRLGAALCLLAAPLLLSLLGQALAVFRNLRLRLMVVLTGAALVPLGILSLVLLRVLESGHERRLQASMEQAIAATTDRLAEQQRELAAAARKWLDPLAAEIVKRGPEALVDAAALELRARLTATLASQKPPDWDGGYMRLELSHGKSGPGLGAFVGDDALEGAETPLRKDPGIYVSWGVPFVGVRFEQDLPGVGLCSLSVARPIDRGMLGGLAPGRGVILCDTKGYPLAAAEGVGVPEQLLAQGARAPGPMAERREALGAVLDQGHPVVVRHLAAGRPWLAAYDVLRDLDDTPRALLGVVDQDQQAVLPLDLGPVPVRTYFLAVGGVLLLLTGLLSFVVTSRITKPIERLERGAQALSRGQLDVSVETEEGGQIGRLTRAFNQMARDLRGRIQDLHHLNRGMQDLTMRLDLKETVASAIGFCARHSPADRVRVLLREPDRDRVHVYGGTAEPVDGRSADVEQILAASGPVSMRLKGGPLAAERALPRLFPEFGSLVALPLLLAGRTRGAVLLLFEAARPPAVHLELLTAMAAQTTVAIENARLYLHAVEDPDTGAHAPEVFRRRVAQEVQRAKEAGRRVALLSVTLVETMRLREALGDERFVALMARVAMHLRRALPAAAVLARAAEDCLQALVPDTGREGADELASAVRKQVAEVPSDLGAGIGRVRVRVRTAVYPEEAASAEFLFHALESRPAEPVALPLQQRMRDLEAEGLVFSSPAMEGVFHTLERAAPTDLTVLLEGETGTGKEILTNLIHRWSRRAHGPLVKVHCAALAETLLQSELFGHEKGAFTGATARKIGKFELAHGGTIFLDEVGEISLDTQVKLLRVLQEREVDRVGGAQPIAVDVRVIAATNRNLQELVAAGRFREDLYYRLQGLVVTVPPLRERKVEIPALVERFRREAVEAGHTRVSGFTPDAMDELFQREWPGNLRELRNLVFRAMVLASGDQVTRGDLLGSRGVSQAGGEPEAVAAPPLPVGPKAPSERGPDRTTMALRLIDERGSVTTQEYCTAAGVSPRQGLRDLTRLVEEGQLEKSGHRRSVRFRRKPVSPDPGETEVPDPEDSPAQGSDMAKS